MPEEKLTKDKIIKSFRKRNIFQKIWEGLKQLISGLIKIWEKIPPKSKFKKGASWGAAIITTFLAVLIGIFFRPGIWHLIDVPAGILMILISTFIIALGIGIVFGIVFGIITIIGWRGFMAMGAFIILMILLKTPFITALIIGLIMVFLEAILGGLIAYCFTSEFKFGTWLKKGGVFLGILAIMAINLLVLKWILNPGNDFEYRLLKSRTSAQIQTPALKISDPSQIGSFQVIKITYGSRNNNIRPEFGKEADIKSKTVNLEPFLKGDSVWKRKHRQLYWTFNTQAFPLNGTVWLPSGEGFFPLILMVHGDYRMEWPSDQGLAYLGHFLATRGFICVSIDQTFLNYSWSGGLNKEVDGRAWMILQHLKLWKEWNQTMGNPFYQKVDMNNIGLLGHGIGAMAIAKASLFNRISRYPDDAKIKFDFNFNIKSLAAIAPGSEKYKSDRNSPLLINQNLLCIQGVHDSLSTGQGGTKLYNGLSFKDNNYWFKSFIYTYRSNHRQFNSEWSPSDYHFPYNLFLNQKLLNKKADQQKICCLFTSAFFETTLRKNLRYFSILRNPGAYAEWLPDDFFISRFEDSQSHHLCTFEEDLDPLTGTPPGVSIEGENLDIWQETNSQFQGFTDNQNKWAVIGWGIHGEKNQLIPRYTVKISEENDFFLNDLSNLALKFAIADGTELYLQHIQSGKDFPAIDFSIELASIQNQKEKISAHNHFIIPVPMKREVAKLAFIDEIIFGKDYRLLLQTVEIPISSFFKNLSQLKLKDISSISFIFDRSERGVIVLDNIGFVRIQDHLPAPAITDQ